MARPRTKVTRYYYARPCDEPAPGWCVAEVEIGPKRAKWCSSLYEPVFTKIAKAIESGKTWQLTGMTKAQAKREAEILNARDTHPTWRKTMVIGKKFARGKRS